VIRNLLKGVVLVVFLLSLLSGCSDGEYKVIDVKIYQNTPAWELAKAVNNQDTKRIAQIVQKSPEVLDYQDPKYGTTLLFWAVGMEKYDAAEALLKAGANPDIISVYEGGTALYRAAGFSFVDNQAKTDSKYVKLLLAYGADPNIGFVGNDHNNSTEIGTTPLMESIGCGFEKTKALVEAGADINYRTEEGMTAAIQALWLADGQISNEIWVMEYAYYLIVEKQADITKPWLGRSYEEVAPVTFLRDWFPELDSKGYRRKMEIIAEFARQGEDYWATEIPKYTLEDIKKIYPDSWEEYIKRY